jgi:hypothetical protein
MIPSRVRAAAFAYYVLDQKVDEVEVLRPVRSLDELKDMKWVFLPEGLDFKLVSIDSVLVGEEDASITEGFLFTSSYNRTYPGFNEVRTYPFGKDARIPETISITQTQIKLGKVYGIQ